jgi:hypothetical protein
MDEQKKMSSKDFDAINDFRISPELRLAAAERLAQTWQPDLSAVCEVDLHCHSFYSDGYNSPSMRVFEAWQRGMKGIAIADHDVFDGQLEAIEAGKIFGITVVPAVEFYTDRPGIELLGFFPDHEDFIKKFKSGIFDTVVEPIRIAKKQQLSGMLARIPECFAKMNFQAGITESDIDQYLRNGISTKGDISVLMWQKYGPELLKAGISTDVKDFQAKYTTKDEFLNLPLELSMDISPEFFVKKIREWGGLPGLAHPTELRTKEKLGNDALYNVICDLAKAGMQFIEVDGWRNGVCPESGIHQTRLFESMRQRWNNENPDCKPLLATNGGDSHNQPNEGLDLGCGRNNNLQPEFGMFSNVSKLTQRQDILCE